MENNLINRVYSIINEFIHPNVIQGFHPSKTPKTKTCPVTGLDISMQAKNSKFISATGVEWYFLHLRPIFKDKLHPYLTDYWKDQPINKQFEEIAHNIRNKDSNKRHSTRRAIKKMLEEKDFLFDPMQLIDKNKLKEAGMTKSAG